MEEEKLDKEIEELKEKRKRLEKNEKEEKEDKDEGEPGTDKQPCPRRGHGDEDKKPLFIIIFIKVKVEM